MKHPITMPVLSDTMTSGRLVRWLKKPGDPVKRGEAIAEVESDKAIMEVEAFQDGYLAGPLAPEDSEIPVRKVIGYITDKPLGEEAPAGKAPEASAKAPPSPPQEAPGVEPSPQVPKPPPPEAPEVRPAPTPPPEVPKAPLPPGTGISPYARVLAQDLGIDLSQVTPGPEGVIQASEVVAAAAMRWAPRPDLEAGPPYRLERPSMIREAVARNMIASLGTPTFYLHARLPLAPLVALARARHLSFTLLLARLCAWCIVQHPLFNAAYTPEGLAWRKRVDVGIAVDTGKGLVTPVLRDAAGRPLEELAEDWRILKDKAERHRLAPEDYRGATFYLSNLGVFPEVYGFDAIVPLGSAAILALGAADGEGNAMGTLSCDHRVVFGADAARFLQTLVKGLSEPEAIVKP